MSLAPLNSFRFRRRHPLPAQRALHRPRPLRRAACVPALLALTLALSCAAPSGPAPPEMKLAEKPKQGGAFADLRSEAAAILGGAIRIRTVNPPGNEAALARRLAELLKKEPGIESRVVHLDQPGSARAAFWARLPGRGEQRPLVLLSHLDVVPADEEAWNLDPFAGVIGGGYVLGRGALDAKGITVVHLLTLVNLARRGAPLSRDIILLATPDEEAGGAEGAARVVRNRRDLLGHAEFLLAEGGSIQPGLGDAPDLWNLSFTEKIPCWVELHTEGPVGHGAMGGSGGAVDRLIRALAEVRRLEFPLRVTPPVAQMFAERAAFAPAEDRAHYRRLAAALKTNPAFRERFLESPVRAALVRNTMAITMLEGSKRVNMLPGTARAAIDARLLPDERCSDFLDRVEAAIADPEVRIRTMLQFEAAASPLQSALRGAIERVAERSRPRGRVLPQVNPGFSDAHWFRSLGITSYGFVPRRLQPLETRGVHGPNERISIDNLVFGVETLSDIILELEP